MRRGRDKVQIQDFPNVTEGMKKMYREVLLPLEIACHFHELHSPRLEEADFDTSPLVIFVGQYSTGKTTFISYLLNEEYMGSRIGPEPTTDKFVAIMHADERKVIPGNALAVDPTKPFRSFSRFGNNFLNRFECSCLPNDLVRNITFIDTPGVLSGEKQSIKRNYDFIEVIRCLSEKCDLIILTFDAHKLDISDEFKRVIETVKEYDSKIRVVLNKADAITVQQLMRVLGALMWSLGKVIDTPECKRIYIGSFWNEQLQNDTLRSFFETEEKDLLDDLAALPRSSLTRKLNDFIRRSRFASICAHIAQEINKGKTIFYKERNKAELIANLPDMYQKLTVELGLSIGDFPDITSLQERLRHFDFAKFTSIKPKLITAVDEMLANDLGRLMDMISKEQSTTKEANTLKGGIFRTINETRENKITSNPFDQAANNPIMASASYEGWVVDSVRAKYDEVFSQLHQHNGKIRGDTARPELLKTKLSNLILAKIWKLSDIDKDGHLDIDEWALCSYLCDLKLAGNEIPQLLPSHLIPPSKRGIS